MLRSVEHGAKNRLATVFFYLNSLVAEGEDPIKGGGQTNFPRAATPEMPEGGPRPMDYFDCSRGLSVYPHEGKVRGTCASIGTPGGGRGSTRIPDGVFKVRGAGALALEDKGLEYRGEGSR
jgi:hypothetical protein